MTAGWLVEVCWETEIKSVGPDRVPRVHWSPHRGRWTYPHRERRKAVERFQQERIAKRPSYTRGHTVRLYELTPVEDPTA